MRNTCKGPDNIIYRGYYTACACIWFLFTSYEHLSRTNEWAKRTSEWVINVHNEWIKTIYTNKPCNNLFIIYYRVLQWNNFAYRFFHCSEKNDITNQISHIVFFTAYRFYSLLPECIKLYTYIINRDYYMTSASYDIYARVRQFSERVSEANEWVSDKCS